MRVGAVANQPVRIPTEASRAIRHHLAVGGWEDEAFGQIWRVGILPKLTEQDSC